MKSVQFVTGFVVFLILIITFILFIPGLPPDIDFKAYHIKAPEENVLRLLDANEILDEAELFYENPNIGMESLIELEDESIVTSDQTGKIFKILANKTVVNLAQLKFPCVSSPFGGGGNEGVRECGWPLGIRLDGKQENLYFMDYFGGMAKLNLKSGSYEVMVPKNTLIENKAGSTPEDLDLAKDGSIYWSDGSTNEDFFTEMLGQPSGRLLRYDPVKNINEVLINDLHFSNGVCLSPDEDFVLVGEIGSASIRRYYLKGENKGKSDIFINGLPGYPDNIRSNGRGGFYVALYFPWDGYTMNTHAYSERPLFRKFILRLRNILLKTLKYVHNIFPEQNMYLTELESYILELRPLLRINTGPKVAVLAEISKSGEIIKILNGKSGKMPNLSQVTVGKNYAYFVCPFDNKIWRMKKSSLR